MGIVTGDSDLVIFDGDDTLWLVEQLYDQALDRAQDLVESAGLQATEWRRTQRAIDLNNVQIHGMSRRRLPASSREATVAVAHRHRVAASPELLRAVVEASETVFEAVAPPMPDVETVLADLAPHFRLALLTKGDPLVQRKRVADSGLAPWFQQVDIVPEKNDSSFCSLLHGFNVTPSRAWSVGNSLASDINPALRLGLHAVWIDAHVWEHEKREESPADPRVVVVEALKELPSILVGSKSRTRPE